MEIHSTWQNENYVSDLRKGTTIGICIDPNNDNPNCFYANPIVAKPVVSGDFVGSVKAGGAVNFYELQVTPHGNGTHTECVGHISASMESVQGAISNPYMIAELISILPETLENGDLIIQRNQIEKALQFNAQALIIRTLPNQKEKLERHYSGKNPPYLSAGAMRFIVEKNYQHLLLDLPSVDREQDEGQVLAHKIFWNYPENPQLDKTITEMIYVPNHIKDDLYLLHLQISHIELDAVPSKPILYPLVKRK